LVDGFSWVATSENCRNFVYLLVLRFCKVNPMLDVSNCPSTTIEIAGKDRIKWLQGMVTNDVKLTSNQVAVESFVVDVKGRVLAHGWVFEAQEALFYVSLGEGQAKSLLTHWDRYIIREDVRLTDISSEWKWGFVAKADVKAHKGLKDNIENHVFIVNDDLATPMQVVLTNDILGRDRVLVGDKTSSDSSSNGSTQPALISHHMFHQLRIRHLLPMVGIDFDEKILPQELARDSRAISFQKGCYLGQETIARLDALGQVQKKLTKLSIIPLGDETRVPPIGLKLHLADKEVGWLTTVEKSLTGSWIALGYVRRSAFPIGTELLADGFSIKVVDELV